MAYQKTKAKETAKNENQWAKEKTRKVKTNKKKKTKKYKTKKLKANAATFPPPHFGYQQLMANKGIRHLINPF